MTHKTSIVPIYDFEPTDTEPHFADPEIKTRVKVHLKLQVHDFPGELYSQRAVSEQARKESHYLRDHAGKNLGVVLVCMFNALDAFQGVNESTLRYYNGDLFRNLRNMVSSGTVGIQRLVLVFNKYDLLRDECPGLGDEELLKKCIDSSVKVLSPLRSSCNPEKVCEVFTILEREEIMNNNRGAPIVLGEAARGLVEVMAGVGSAQTVIPEAATNYSSRHFS